MMIEIRDMFFIVGWISLMPRMTLVFNWFQTWMIVDSFAGSYVN